MPDTIIYNPPKITPHLSESGYSWLAGVCYGLKLGLKLGMSKAQRLENESGFPATSEHMARNEESLKTIRRIEKILEVDSIKLKTDLAN